MFKRKSIINLLIVITFFFAFKTSVLASSSNIELSTQSSNIKVGDEFEVNVKVQSDTNLGTWNFIVNHSDNLALVSGTENISDVANEVIQSKDYSIRYKAISTGESNISISSISINEYETNNSIEIGNVNSINISINSSGEFVNEGGHIFYYKDGVMQKGIVEIDGNKYLFGVNSGYLYYGWATTPDGNKYYSGEDGILKSGVAEIDGKKYLFGVTSNKLYYGWATTPDGNKYYSDITGVLKTGLNIVNNQKYYFDDDNCNSIIGWINAPDGKKYYSGEDGILKSGVTEIEGKKYLFGITSNMLYYGWATTPDGKKYYSDEDGVLQEGFITIKNNNYYFDEENCYMSTGWVEVNGKKYYSGSNGILKSGVTEIDGKKYLFGVYSNMLYYGWATTPDGNKYYSGEDGILKSGIVEIDGNKYLFGVLSNKLYYGWATTPDGNTYYTNSEGIIQTGSMTIDGVDYNFDANGVLQTGYQTIFGKTYYFYTNGTKAKGVVKIQGERNYFDFNTGELLNRNVKHIVDVSTWQGYLNWDALWSSGQIDGVIIRLGYGSAVGEPCILDNKFEYNLSEIRRLNIPYSVYFYTYAQNADSAAVEANYVADVLNAYNVNDMSFPIFFDAEEGYFWGFTYTSDVYALTTTTFANILRSRGYNSVGVYGSVSKFESGYLNNPSIRSFPLWVAQYYTVNQYSGPSMGWQYTSEGRIPGYDGNLDLSIFY